MDTEILRGIFMKIDPQFCRVDAGLDTILGKWKIPIILYLLKNQTIFNFRWDSRVDCSSN